MSSLIFHIEADKVDSNLLESIKAFFGNQKIEILVKSEERLSDIIKENRKSKISYVFEGDEFDTVSKKILNDESVDFEPFKRIEQ